MTNPDSSQPGGLRQAPPPGHSRVRMHVPVTGGLLRDFIELRSVVAKLDAYRSVLVDVLALAGQAPELGDKELRAALVVLGERAAGLLEGGIR